MHMHVLFVWILVVAFTSCAISNAKYLELPDGGVLEETWNDDGYAETEWVVRRVNLGNGPELVRKCGRYRGDNRKLAKRNDPNDGPDELCVPHFPEPVEIFCAAWKSDGINVWTHITPKSSVCDGNGFQTYMVFYVWTRSGLGVSDSVVANYERPLGHWGCIGEALDPLRSIYLHQPRCDGWMGGRHVVSVWNENYGYPEGNDGLYIDVYGDSFGHKIILAAPGIAEIPLYLAPVLDEFRHDGMRIYPVDIIDAPVADDEEEMDDFRNYLRHNPLPEPENYIDDNGFLRLRPMMFYALSLPQNDNYLHTFKFFVHLWEHDGIMHGDRARTLCGGNMNDGRFADWVNDAARRYIRGAGTLRIDLQTPNVVINEYPEWRFANVQLQHLGNSYAQVNILQGFDIGVTRIRRALIASLVKNEHVTLIPYNMRTRREEFSIHADGSQYTDTWIIKGMTFKEYAGAQPRY